jgi:hypothetical protein
MATPRHRKRTTLTQPSGMKPALKAPLRSLVLLLPSLGQLRSHVLLPSLGQLRSHVLLLRPKLVLSLRRAKPEPSPRVLRRVRLPLSHVLLHIDRDKDRNKAACFNHKGIDYTKACHTYSGEETCLRSTTRKVGGGAGCGSENWVGLTPVNQAYYSVVARR